MKAIKLILSATMVSLFLSFQPLNAGNEKPQSSAIGSSMQKGILLYVNEYRAKKD